MNRVRSSHTVWLGVLLFIFLVHCALYYPFMPDDSLIPFQYIKRLIQGKGLTWTDGAPVEGYSNFLWLIILAFFHLLGADIIESSRLFGIFCMSACVWVLYVNIFESRRPDNSPGNSTFKPAFADFIPVILFITSGITAAWAVGGLEQPLIAALLALGVRGIYKIIVAEDPERETWTTAFWFALLALVRPDTPLFGVMGGAAVAIICWRRLDPIAPGIRIVLWTLIAWGSLTLFRLFYFNDFVPNTAHVKLTLSPHYLNQGVRYVLRGIGVNAIPLIGVLALPYLLIISDKGRDRSLVLSFLAFPWLAYLIVMGGDVNPPARHFIPLIVIACFACTELLNWCLNELTSAGKRELTWLLPTLIVLHVVIQGADRELQDARNPTEFFEQDRLLVGETLKRAFSRKNPLLAVDGAGAVPFAADLPALDLLGLNDRFIGRESSEKLGDGWLGHELGDTEYVLARKPDILLFGSYKGEWDGAYPGGKKLVQDPRFKENYQQVRLWSGGEHLVHSELWIRRNGKLGVQKIEGGFEIPCYLFEPRPTIHVIGDNRTLCELKENSAVNLQQLGILPLIAPATPLVAPSGTATSGNLHGNISFSPELPQSSIVADALSNQSQTLQVLVPNGASVWLERVVLK